MKLVVQIPCLNEEATLPSVLESIPASIDGIDEIVVVVIDDGCTDRTVEIAEQFGVTHFVRHASTRGLARSFQDGVSYALALGADILVNTDGDNQYPQERITDLVRPIVERKADIVIADRQVREIEHFSPGKVMLQRFGSSVVNRVAGTRLPDAASGFRAYSRETLFRLNTVTRFSYCMETIIQAGNMRLAIASVPITTNTKTRESRLFRSTREHVVKSAAAIIRGYIMYRPYMIFGWSMIVFGILGLVPFVRYAALTAIGEGGGHLQSLILGAVLMVMSCVSGMLGVVADLIRTNRILVEHSLELAKRTRFGDVREAPAGADVPGERLTQGELAPARSLSSL